MSESVNITHDKKLIFRILELEYAINLLMSLKLVKHESRMRVRFVKLLTERYAEFQEEYNNLIKQYAQLGQDGKPIFEKLDNGQTTTKINDINGFKEELNDLTKEEFVVVVDDNNINMIKSVKDSLLNCDLEFEGDNAIDHDLICQRFENLNL